MTNELVLIGGGGHALSLLDIIPSTFNVAGYVDIIDNADMPLPYFGNDKEFISSYPSSSYNIIITTVSGADCNLDHRSKVINKYSDYTSPIVIAPTAIVSQSASIGSGSTIFHRAVVNTSACIGEHSIINTGAIVEHGCNIGENVFIGPGAIICGGVTIGDNAYIGAGAIVKPGIMICDSTILGAGAVAVANISRPGVYVGTPAKFSRKK